MNGWLLILIIFIVTVWLLESVLSLLNLRNQPQTLSDDFKDVYDPEKYRKSLEYHKTTTNFSLLEKGVSTALTLAFLLLGGFDFIDLTARSFGYEMIGSGLIFVGILMLLSFLANLPFQIYSTFVIEERFGFNRTTAKTFIIDNVKSILLTVILGGILLASILWFFETTGAFAWLYCWLATVLFTFFIQLIAPVVIMPLFNKFTPLKDSTLKDEITKYTTSQKFTLQGIFTMDGSRRSSKLNAFFTGFGKFRKVVLFDTLIEKLSEQQIIAVLAHEIGHAKLKHIWKGLVLFIIQSGIIFYILSIFLAQEDFAIAFGMSHSSTYASLFFFGYLFAPINLLVSILFNKLSRKYEYEADNFAAKTTGESKALITALKILTKENMATLYPHPLYVLFYYSHPPLKERISALEKFDSEHTF